MSQPPTKRPRRVVLSDDERPVIKTRRTLARSASSSQTTGSDRFSASQNTVPTGKPSLPKSKARKQSSASAASSKSPEKATKKRSLGEEKENKSIQSFFGRATEEQRWTRRVQTPLPDLSDGEAGDAIEDDSLDEAFANLADGIGDEKRVLDRRKTLAHGSLDGSCRSAQNTPKATQRFLKPSKPPTEEGDRPSEYNNDGLGRPWAERFAPTSLEELAVHKKKVTDVQNLLAAVLQGRDRHRLLVLKGPAGSGKTTSLALLSKALPFDISEWRSPTVADTGIQSFSSQFQDFLSRGGSFGTLDVGSHQTDEASVDQPRQSQPPKRIILVEEFPSTMTLSSSALASFRSVLSQYLAAAVSPRSATLDRAAPRPTSHPPIVLIISESLLTSATAATDGFTAHRLLGPDLCNHPYTAMIEFNPVAPTLIQKALELTSKKEAMISKRRRRPGPAVFKRLAELGDVRSAVNGLEFLCVRGDADSDWGGRTASKSRRSDKTSSKLTTMEKESIELITQREATLGIFHAVGKVVWNKRDNPEVTDPKSHPPPKPPDHLPAFDRAQTSQVDPDKLLNEIGTDIQTFTAALHENYVLSTNGPDFHDSASDCINFLSDSDLLGPGSRQTSRSSRPTYGGGGAVMQAGGVDVLRQNEISFQVAVRGLLFSLPFPVSRGPHPHGGKGASLKMFFPASLKMWKTTEEINDLVSTQMARLPLASDTDDLRSLVPSGESDGVESWKSRNFSFQPLSDPDGDCLETTPRPWVTRDELLLDRLPYISQMHMAMRSNQNFDMREIKKITDIKGATALSADDDDALNMASDIDHSGTAVDLSAADETTDRVAPPSKGARPGWPSPAKAKAQAAFSLDKDADAGIEKLYIEEDDIEDD